MFDALLRGELPDGTRVGNPGQPHRPGTDLTFSLPKSWSLLALVGGDRRIAEAYREAVVETLRWAERNAAQTRLTKNGAIRLVRTDNLAIGLFQHDTNRNQEPNLHFHGVVANVTRGPDGVLVVAGSGWAGFDASRGTPPAAHTVRIFHVPTAAAP